jgi:hypothetical protein
MLSPRHASVKGAIGTGISPVPNPAASTPLEIKKSRTPLIAASVIVE